MDTENHEMENRDAKKSPEKYIHVTDIPTEKLDQDEDYKKSENKKPSEKNNDLKEKSEQDRNQGDETVGIP